MRFWAFIVLAIPAWCGGALNAGQQKALTAWLAAHASYRAATDADCDCSIEIRQMRDGYGDPRYALPDYHPFTATGDFNDDGVEDFAVALIDENAAAGRFTLAVFNGPFSMRPAAPAFLKADFDLRRDRLFYFGSRRAKPYRLWIAPFNSDDIVKLVPVRNSYRLE